MADGTTASVTNPAVTEEAFKKYNKQQLIKKVVVVSVILLVAWFAYKSFLG